MGRAGCRWEEGSEQAASRKGVDNGRAVARGRAECDQGAGSGHGVRKGAGSGQWAVSIE